MASEPASSWLLVLPDSCLLVVLQHVADSDQRSLFNAARAHSKLHQIAKTALHSIAIKCAPPQADSMLEYLEKHGQHVEHLSLEVERVPAPRWQHNTQTVSIRQLAPNLKLSSLLLTHLQLQLQPGLGFQGLLGAAARVAALKQLEDCQLLDRDRSEMLAAALSLLPTGLEHLSIRSLSVNNNKLARFPTGPLERLQHLTFLDLAGNDLQGPDEASPALQPLQALTALMDLRLDSTGSSQRDVVVAANMLSGACHLTRLELHVCEYEPTILAGKALLQHLRLTGCSGVDDAGHGAHCSALLSHLQPLQQLTYLNLAGYTAEDGNPPAAAYAALTASSKLQVLNLFGCTLPAGVWQHMFPAGRQLPQLESLILSGILEPPVAQSSCFATVPDGALLVSCCPGLQRLSMNELHCSEALLAPLQGLERLQSLNVGDPYATTAGGLQAVCGLKGLRELSLAAPRTADALLLLQLTQLQHLTDLRYWGPGKAAMGNDSLRITFDCKDPGDEPVWHQILQHHLQHPEPEVAQQAAAALAEGRGAAA